MFNFWKRKEGSKTKYLHLATDLKGVEEWCEKNKVSLEDGYVKSFSRVKEIMKIQVEEKVPIVSFLVLRLKEDKKELLEVFKEFTEGDFLINFLKEHKIKVTLLGKWYDLPAEIVERLKRLVEETKDYDYFFLNFCLNYDGQEEIIDAIKIILRQVMAGKLSVENVSKEEIKENIYSSYFIAPDLMIKNKEEKMDGFFLWDSGGAKIVFTRKFFPDFSGEDLKKLLRN